MGNACGCCSDVSATEHPHQRRPSTDRGAGGGGGGKIEVAPTPLSMHVGDINTGIPTTTDVDDSTNTTAAAAANGGGAGGAGGGPNGPAAVSAAPKTPHGSVLPLALPAGTGNGAGSEQKVVAIGGGGGGSASIRVIPPPPQRAIVNGWSVVSNQHRSLICGFCGGRTCKREDYKKQTTPNAIKGLHSNWISNILLACQRPSSRLIREFGLIAQFKQHRIGAIVNVQLSGEHAFCGDGIHPSGFSYLPEEFMNHGIFFYNFGWTDMSTPSMHAMMNIVQVMSQHINDRREKVAVHCHAGMGRTGIVCACYLIYGMGLSALEAVEMVRSHRPGTVETKAQLQFVTAFDLYVRQQRLIFTVPGHADASTFFTLTNAMTRQSIYLRGEESVRYKQAPKLITFICERLSSLTAHSLGRTLVATAFIDVGRDWSFLREKELRNLKLRLNSDDWYELAKSDIRYLAQLLLDYCDALTEPIFPPVAPVLAMKSGGLGMQSWAQLAPVLLRGSLYQLTTIDTIFKLLRALRLEEMPDSSVGARVWMRFAYALTHPPVQLPAPRPFRTLRLMVAPNPTTPNGTAEPAPVNGVSDGSFQNVFMAPPNYVYPKGFEPKSAAATAAAAAAALAFEQPLSGGVSPRLQLNGAGVASMRGATPPPVLSINGVPQNGGAGAEGFGIASGFGSAMLGLSGHDLSTGGALLNSGRRSRSGSRVGNLDRGIITRTPTIGTGSRPTSAARRSGGGLGSSVGIGSGGSTIGLATSSTLTASARATVATNAASGMHTVNDPNTLAVSGGSGGAAGSNDNALVSSVNRDLALWSAANSANPNANANATAASNDHKHAASGLLMLPPGSGAAGAGGGDNTGTPPDPISRTPTPQPLVPLQPLAVPTLVPIGGGAAGAGSSGSPLAAGTGAAGAATAAVDEPIDIDSGRWPYTALTRLGECLRVWSEERQWSNLFREYNDSRARFAVGVLPPAAAAANAAAAVAAPLAAAAQQQPSAALAPLSVPANPNGGGGAPFAAGFLTPPHKGVESPVNIVISTGTTSPLMPKGGTLEKQADANAATPSAVGAASGSGSGAAALSDDVITSKLNELLRSLSPDRHAKVLQSLLQSSAATVQPRQPSASTTNDGSTTPPTLLPNAATQSPLPAPPASTSASSTTTTASSASSSASASNTTAGNSNLSVPLNQMTGGDTSSSGVSGPASGRKLSPSPSQQRRTLTATAILASAAAKGLTPPHSARGITNPLLPPSTVAATTNSNASSASSTATTNGAPAQAPAASPLALPAGAPAVPLMILRKPALPTPTSSSNATATAAPTAIGATATPAPTSAGAPTSGGGTGASPRLLSLPPGANRLKPIILLPATSGGATATNAAPGGSAPNSGRLSNRALPSVNGTTTNTAVTTSGGSAAKSTAPAPAPAPAAAVPFDRYAPITSNFGAEDEPIPLTRTSSFGGVPGVSVAVPLALITPSASASAARSTSPQPAVAPPPPMDRYSAVSYAPPSPATGPAVVSASTTKPHHPHTHTTHHHPSAARAAASAVDDDDDSDDEIIHIAPAQPSGGASAAQRKLTHSGSGANGGGPVPAPALKSTTPSPPPPDVITPPHSHNRNPSHADLEPDRMF